MSTWKYTELIGVDFVVDFVAAAYLVETLDDDARRVAEHAGIELGERTSSVVERVRYDDKLNTFTVDDKTAAHAFRYTFEYIRRGDRQ